MAHGMMALQWHQWLTGCKAPAGTPGTQSIFYPIYIKLKKINKNLNYFNNIQFLLGLTSHLISCLYKKLDMLRQ